LAVEELEHAYPHCWRCKNPVIFRATEQWFASVDAMKEAAIEACHEIKWIPEWGKDRMIAMLVERSDWCISRQRHWGLPIPVFYCESCEEPLCTPETIEAVATLFGEKGSNAWHEMEVKDILPKGILCSKCGASGFFKGDDTLDCWFDSGSTHAEVLSSGRYPGGRLPSDLYIEGGDQYRGWFQSSMLTSIAANGIAPYKRIITHGWTVDGEGKAMHKSLGNAVSPDQVLNEYGADILRLWVASSDYKADTKMSKDILKQLSDIYLKIRNTARFILGNLNGFDSDKLVAYEDMQELDRWALNKLNKLIISVAASYEKYEYHTIYHAIHNFCTIDMSNFYLDVIKDRLYCDITDGLPRRSAQTAIYIILDAVVRMLAPILAFTSEEIWAAMPHHSGIERVSVLLNDMPVPDEKHVFSAQLEEKWDKLLRLRSDVNKALENARTAKVIGKPLDAEVRIHITDESMTLTDEMLTFADDLDSASLFIVSSVEMVVGQGAGLQGTEFSGISIDVKRSEAPKCARCWTHRDGVGSSDEHSDLCPRCVEAIETV
jgi:isoleucyl-tRNA synthetase